MITLVAVLVCFALLVAAATYTTFVHNGAVFVVLGLLMGAAPGAQVPVVGVSALFLLSVGTWVALATARHAWPEPTWVSGALICLVAVSAFTLVAHPVTSAAVSDFLRWASVTLLVYPLQVIPARQLVVVGRCFVAGALVAALFGAWLLTGGVPGAWGSLLGLDPEAIPRVVVNPDGSQTYRLIGTYVDPNLAGVVLGIALLVALVVLRGRWRLVCCAALGAATIATLSRSLWASAVVAGLLVVVASRLPGRFRARLAVLLAVGAAAALLVPAVRARLLNSFGDSDIGSHARADGLAQAVSLLHGHWLFGTGFGSPEINDPVVASTTNFAANAPLVALYRGGVLAGIVFTLVLVLTAVLAWRLLRSGRLEHTLLGAGVLGLVLVAFQLDFTVVSLLPSTAAFTLLLAIVDRLGSDVLVPQPELSEVTAP